MKKIPIKKIPTGNHQAVVYKAKNRKFSRRLLDHSIQGILIFASVFVAFWLSDFRQKQEEKSTSRAAVESVINEIKQNLAILNTWTPRHGEMLERSEEFLINSLDTATIFNPWQFNDGPFMSEIITYDSWDIIRQTNPQMDLGTRLLINRIYRQQEYVDKALQNLVSDFLTQREIYDPNKVRENYILFHMLIGDLWGQGDAMIREYEFALKELKSK